MTITATLSRPTTGHSKRTKAKASKSNLVQQTFQWDAPSAGMVSSKSTSARPLVAARETRERLGRCERAGGLMEKVLSRYGISPEEFRLAVEELRASRASSSRTTK
jgi:hypothetical protein